MVILINSSKDLIISRQSRVYQKENAVNSLIIYCPRTLDQVEDMSELYGILYYTTATNDAYVEALDQIESDKDGYVAYTLSIGSKFTASAGENTVSMAFTRDRNGEEVVMHTGEIKIPIYKWDNAFKYVSTDGLASIVNRIHEIEDKVPDDLIIEEDVLYLAKKVMNETSQKEELTPMADGVEILIPGDKDSEDQDHDGIIDLDEDTPEEGYEYIDLDGDTSNTGTNTSNTDTTSSSSESSDSSLDSSDSTDYQFVEL